MVNMPTRERHSRSFWPDAGHFPRLMFFSWNACSISSEDLQDTVKDLSCTEKWDILCIQEGLRNVSQGVFQEGGVTRIQGDAQMRGATMILLNQRASKRLRRHIIAQDYVIAELAMIPPVLIISHHAPSAHAKDDEYQDSFDRLLADIESLNPPHRNTNIRLIWCCDLNTQVNAHPPDIGPWTNGGEREGEWASGHRVRRHSNPFLEDFLHFC